MGYGDNVNPRENTFFFDISDDDDLSQPFFQGHLDLCGVRIPSGFDGTSIGFKECETETGTYSDVSWEGTVVAFTVSAPVTLKFDPAKLTGSKWLKMTSDANEDGDVEIEPIFRDFS